MAVSLGRPWIEPVEISTSGEGEAAEVTGAPEAADEEPGVELEEGAAPAEGAEPEDDAGPAEEGDAAEAP